MWDPVTDGRCHVDLPPLRKGTHHGLNAVIIVDDDYDYGEEENGSFHFRIAIASVAQGTAIAAVYSSEKGAWGQLATAGAWTSLPSERPGVAVGDAVYWLLNDGRVLSLKLRDGGLSILPAKVPSLYADNVQLTRTPDGEIGLAAVSGSALHILALETDDEYGTTSWVVRRTVVLDEKIVPSGGPVGDNGEPRYHARIVGTHDDGAVVFMWTVHGVFMVRLQLEPEATQTITKKLHGIDETNGHFYAVYPFASFFTPTR